MTTSFEIVGFDGANELVKKITKETQRQVDLASKLGINKALDQIVYGRVSNINANTVKPTGAISRAAKALKMPVEHLYYRTFVKGIKVSAGKGRLAKPYASAMIRGTGINVVDFLVSGNDAKSMYGFSTRKKGIGKRSKIDMQSRVNAARIGGRRSGNIKIGSRTYKNSYLEDGKARNRSEALNRHYMENLGAGKFKLAEKRFLLIQKKDKGQKLPYPSKAIKIKRARVLRALNAANKISLRANIKKIPEIQTLEVHKRLKKLGFKIT